MDGDTFQSVLVSAQKSLMGGDLPAARGYVSSALKQEPENIEALYMSVVIERYAGQLSAADKALSQLIERTPEFGRAWQEKGHLALRRGDQRSALHAFEAAVRLNPALDASWNAIARIQSARGYAPASQQASAQSARIKALPKALVAVMHHLYEGRLLKAEEKCRAFLKGQPRNTEGMRLLADIAIRTGVYGDAEILLSNAVSFEPDNIQLRLDYIQLLRKRQKYRESLDQSNHLLEQDPNNPTFLSNVAIDHMHTGSFERAADLFNQVLALIPDDPVTLTSKGHALKTRGAHDDAVQCYQHATRVKSDHGDAWYGLANLKTYRFSEAEKAAMQQALSSPHLIPGDRVHIAFALAKAFEDDGKTSEAFEHYQMGNALKKHASRYDADQMSEELRAQARAATTDFFTNTCRKGGCPAPDPIFIVGLPRAGSTLIEQILASHSQIDGTLELPHILAAAHSLRGRIGQNRYPDALLDLSDDEAKSLGEAYIKDTQAYRSGAPFFTDKMPNNFRHIGLIKRILPNAKIIDARRDAMACCFSGFKQLFAEGQEFSYNLADIGRYYRDYVALMDHFDKAAPGMVLRVQYEQVVKDIETQVRRMLTYLGLPFEDACLSFHRTERAVRTASSEQVREAINTKGLHAWKPFEPWLDPLKSALGPELLP